MKKKLFLIGGFVFMALPLLSGCSKKTETVLRVLSSEDYIYLYDDEDPAVDVEGEEFKYRKQDLIHQFEEKMEEKHPEFGNVKVIYTCSDTNETMYNELKTGKAIYDLICVSDYMVQKMIFDDLIVPFKDKETNIPNYFNDASNVCVEIRDRLSNIEAIGFENINGKREQVTKLLGDYCVGYMWGTLGILYNPDFEGLSEDAKENIHEDVKSWEALENKRYYHAASIKNSMRDTYAVGIVRAFNDKLEEAKSKTYPFVETIDGKENTFNSYLEYLSYFFNKCDVDTVKKVEAALDKIKKNAFGLELDSGKQDIVDGKIGMNLAWSGDAVYAMEQAEDLNKELYYSLPNLGSNLWFDAYAMPKRPRTNPRTEAEETLAYEFLNFLCDSDTAEQNMAYTGYTSFVSGEPVYNLLLDWYDARTDYLYYYDEETDDYYDVYVKNGEEAVEISYEDFIPSKHNAELDECGLYYLGPTYDEKGKLIYDDDELVLTEQPFLDPLCGVENDEGEYDCSQVFYKNITVNHLLNDCNIETIYKVKDEVAYFFGGLEEDQAFYSYLYLPMLNEGNDWTGLDFYCQIPSMNSLEYCAVMAYDPINNENIVKMWEEFKSDNLPTWAIILFAFEGVALVGGLSAFFITKGVRNNIKKKRKLESN